MIRFWEKDKLCPEGFHKMMRTVHRLGFKIGLHMAEEAGFVPTLLVGKPDIRLDSEEDSSVFAAARRFRERVRGSKQNNEVNMLKNGKNKV